jgi:hypothetical protein
MYKIEKDAYLYQALLTSFIPLGGALGSLLS